ncbi:MAG: hypothetical protein ACREOW_12680 [Thermodesulfobacteriota bacterium]
MSVETGNFIRVNVRLLLKFFDEKPPESQRHATSIVAVAGEDLGVGLLKHCLERTQSAKVKVLSGIPTIGKRNPETHQQGPYLDRWVDVVWPDGSGQLFQTEIKNLSAHAIGGRILKVDASLEEVTRFMIERWRSLWGSYPNIPEYAKNVLKPMKRPSEVDLSHVLQPLIVYWFALHPEGRRESFFSVDLEAGYDFSRLWFFSMSTYLRSLNEDVIELEMPIAAKRMSWLHKLFPGQ